MTLALFVALSLLVAACGGPQTPQYHQKLIVLAIDGLDPDLVSHFMDESKLPNMQKLARQGALQRLETTPSPSMSAWASFATGLNPGKHGVFGSDPSSVRHGTPFWTLAGRAGVRSSVLDVPLTFPPEAVPNGELLSGWPTPDLRNTPGTSSYFASDVPRDDDGVARRGIARRRLTFSGNTARTVLSGPDGLTIPLSLFWNRQDKAATIGIGGDSFRLEEGEWSKWIDVDFSAHWFSHRHGLIEFCLARAGTTFALYASPIEWRPDRPPAALASPARLSSDLYERLGPYRTLGWSDAAVALDDDLIDERAFLDDVDRAFDDHAQIILQRIDTRNWDVLVGGIDSLDHVQHVTWRLMNPALPGYDRALAAKYGDAIEHMYRRCDDLLGDVVAHAGPDTAVIVMSAYGAHGVAQTFDLDRWLAEEGLRGKASVDDAGGITIAPEARGVEDHLVARLTALLDPSTRLPVVTHVYKREDVYTGPYAAYAPALQVGVAPGYAIGHGSSVLSPNTRRWSAEHRGLDYVSVPGTLISSRPTTTDTPRVVDMAPTVLRYFGVPIPGDIDGTPLF